MNDNEEDNDRLDLSALAARADAEHWDRVLAATRLRVDAAVTRRAHDPLATIAGWTRPLLVAAGTALLVLLPVEIALEAREARTEQVQRLVALSADVLHAGAAPSATDFLGALAPKSAP
jgi:hypothetical protein